MGSYAAFLPAFMLDHHLRRDCCLADLLQTQADLTFPAAVRFAKEHVCASLPGVQLQEFYPQLYPIARMASKSDQSWLRAAGTMEGTCP
eukprot:366436-Chlamydomonas_euryale.AAC.7